MYIVQQSSMYTVQQTKTINYNIMYLNIIFKLLFYFLFLEFINSIVPSNQLNPKEVREVAYLRVFFI